MAKKHKNFNKSAWAKLGSGRAPINGVAARVTGHDARQLKYVELLEKAKRTKDPSKRSALMAEARAAKADYEARMLGKAAETKARKALERAAWLHENRKK